MNKTVNNKTEKTVVTNNRYIVTTQGKVIDKVTNEELPTIKHGGSTKHGHYRGVFLEDIDGNKVKHYVHRLVAEAFIPNPENKTDVSFIDGDFTNSNVDNLQWLTRSESMYKVNKEGRVAITRFRTPLDIVFKIRFESEVLGTSANKLAVKYNRATTSVKKIIRYETFNDLETIELQKQVFNNLHNILN